MKYGATSDMFHSLIVTCQQCGKNNKGREYCSNCGKYLNPRMRGTIKGTLKGTFLSDNYSVLCGSISTGNNGKGR